MLIFLGRQCLQQIYSPPPLSAQASPVLYCMAPLGLRWICDSLHVRLQVSFAAYCTQLSQHPGDCLYSFWFIARFFPMSSYCRQEFSIIDKPGDGWGEGGTDTVCYLLGMHFFFGPLLVDRKYPSCLLLLNSACQLGVGSSHSFSAFHIMSWTPHPNVYTHGAANTFLLPSNSLRTKTQLHFWKSLQLPGAAGLLIFLKEGW